MRLSTLTVTWAALLVCGSRAFNLTRLTLVGLAEYAQVAAHNSGTGALPQSLWTDWAKTQTGNTTAQLDCGARSLTLHASLERDGLFMRHGPVLVPAPLAGVVDEALAWAAAHPEDLVQLHVSKCTDATATRTNARGATRRLTGRGHAPEDACWEAVRALMRDKGVGTFAVDAMRVGGFKDSQCIPRGLSVAAAHAQFRAPGGGSVLWLPPLCVQENYDPEPVCFGIQRGGPNGTFAFTCYDEHGSRERVRAWAPMDAYLEAVAGSGKPSAELAAAGNAVLARASNRRAGVEHTRARGDRQVMVQAHWQYDTISVVIGALHLSSILKAAAGSRLGRTLACRLIGKEGPRIADTPGLDQAVAAAVRAETARCGPTVGDAMYPRAGLVELDGVCAEDSRGIAQLLYARMWRLQHERERGEA